MNTLSWLPLLLAVCVVTIRADDPFTVDRNGVVATTTTTTASATTTTSSSMTMTKASKTSTTASSTSASATSTSSAMTNTFHWNGGEIAALVILLGFLIFGVIFIATWQVRRMRARRRDNAGLGACSKHERNSSVDMDGPDADAGMIMTQSSQLFQPYGSLANNDLEHQPAGLLAVPSSFSAYCGPTPSLIVSPANSLRQSRSPSPYSQAALRPAFPNTLRRLYSFEEFPR